MFYEIKSLIARMQKLISLGDERKDSNHKFIDPEDISGKKVCSDSCTFDYSMIRISVYV